MTDAERVESPVTSEHYAYCKEATCDGCLPSDADLDSFSIIELWGEMLKRCIPQSPETKTRDGALAAIRSDGAHYRALSLRLRKVESDG